MVSEYKTVRTDLAIEAKDMYTAESDDQKNASGVISEEHTYQDVRINRIQISKEGEKKLHKKAGNYITVFADGVKEQDTQRQADAAKVFEKELTYMMKKNKIDSNAEGLIVGLGNWNVTPDALGPMTTEKVLVTNHLFELEYESVQEGYRPVAAISPGVMGVTGLETSDIILSLIDDFQPDFVLVVDALASRSIERINETIQITDTGIHPGSGVGNRRKELSKETLGIPVIAIGVPTVVDAVTIANDTLDYLLRHMGREWREKDKPKKSLLPGFLPSGHDDLSDDDVPDEEQRSAFLGLIGTLTPEEKRSLLEDVLTPSGRNMIVTPKEVDSFMEDMAHLVAEGINAALHEKVRVNPGTYTR